VILELEIVSDVSMTLMESIVKFAKEDSSEMQRNNHALSVFVTNLEQTNRKLPSVITHQVNVPAFPMLLVKSAMNALPITGDFLQE
jgi:hypothetical protein